MMEKRLEMMEQMVGQMIGHTAEKSKMLNKHKQTIFSVRERTYWTI
jgi:protein CpxP